MMTTFQLLDCDYIMLENYPVVRLFGKTKEGKSVCAFYKDYFPYFYVLPKSKSELKEYLEKNYKDQIIAIEEVEKFLPVGYQKEKTRLVKITTKDPSKVSSIREALFSQKFTDNIFEADILFKYRFMNDLGLSGLKWVKTTGALTSTKTVTSPINISVDTIEETESEDSVPFKYMAFDIETISRKRKCLTREKTGS